MKHQCKSSINVAAAGGGASLENVIYIECKWFLTSKGSPDELEGREMINGRGKKKNKQVLIHKSDLFYNLCFLVKYWIIWTFIEMKPCEKFRGKKLYLVELLTLIDIWNVTQTTRCFFVRCQKIKKGFIFNNVLYFKSLLNVKSLWKVNKTVNKCSGIKSTIFYSS